MKLIATMAAGAALVSLGACDRMTPSSQTAANERTRTAPPTKTGPDAIRASSTSNGLPPTAGAPNGEGLAGNPNAIPASSTLTPVVDRAFLIGRWTDARDCNTAGEFTADGRYTNTTGQNAAWALDGNHLTLTFGGASPRTVQVSALDQNTLEVTNPDGSTGRSTRC
jgi:hypothetical protein